MQRQRLQPPSTPHLRGNACEGVKVTDAHSIVYCAGQVAFDSARNVVGKGDIRAQTRQALLNLERVVRDAGGDLTNVVKLTTFITDFDLLEGMLETRAEFPLQDFASSTVQITRLVHPDLLIEIEAVAIID